MKRILSFLLAVLMLCSVLSVLAESTDTAVVGTWKMTKYVVDDKTYDHPETSGNKKIIIFEEDGTAQVTINKNVYAATWTQEGSTVHLLYEDGDKADFAVEPEQLVYKTGNQVQYFSPWDPFGLGLGGVLKYDTVRTPLSGAVLQYDAPQGWTEVKEQLASSQEYSILYTDTAENANYGVQIAVDLPYESYAKLTSEADITAFLKQVAERLAKSYTDTAIESLTIDGHPAVLWTNKVSFTQVLTLRDNRVIYLTYGLAGAAARNASDYPYDPADTRALAQKFKYESGAADASPIRYDGMYIGPALYMDESFQGFRFYPDGKFIGYNLMTTEEALMNNYGSSMQSWHDNDFGTYTVSNGELVAKTPSYHKDENTGKYIHGLSEKEEYWPIEGDHFTITRNGKDYVYTFHPSTEFKNWNR